MLYIVSGFMRSGTSMLMDALSAGGRPHGLKCEWSRARDERMNAGKEYLPNDSYREIDLKEYGRVDFPLRHDGSLIKVMSWGLEQMRRTSGFRCVFMLRDPYEIAESHARSFGKELAITVGGVRVPASESDAWPAMYHREMKAAVIRAETRIDCHSLHVFRYAEVLHDPFEHFRRLKNAGWPIDHELAAMQVKPERKRVASTA